MLIRDVGLTIQALEDRAIITCSTAGQTAGTTQNVLQSTTAATGISGRLIDRLGGDTMLTERYAVAMPSAYLWASRGSTEADRKLTLGLKLQHGDSSGGGDQVDFSTGSQPVDQTFFTTAGTTPMSNWTTGPFYGQTKPTVYDIRAAKRYIRLVVSSSKDKSTTESSGDESYHVAAAITFMAGYQFPPATWSSQGSTSTST